MRDSLSFSREIPGQSAQERGERAAFTMNAACGFPLEWRGCYTGQTALWVDDAYSHPAKAHPSLAFRILRHLEELGLLKEGDVARESGKESPGFSHGENVNGLKELRSTWAFAKLGQSGSISPRKESCK